MPELALRLKKIKDCMPSLKSIGIVFGSAFVCVLIILSELGQLILMSFLIVIMLLCLAKGLDDTLK